MPLADEIMGDLKKRKPMGKEPADTGDAEPDEMDAAEPEEGGDEDMAVQEFMDAVKADDVGGAKAALKSFIRICYPSMGE